MAISYKDAGVDLDLYADAMRRIPRLLKQTHRPGVMPLDGGFAGLFRLFDGSRKYEDPVLVSGTDGVGTKLKLAVRTKTYNTVGIDLVAMCVNDCLCVGAEPLFFLDYLALGKDDPELIAGLVLMVLLSVLATVFPATMGPQADPLTTPEVIKPEWFFYATFRWLKLFSGTFAVLSMGFIVFTMFVWPFIDKWLRRITGLEDISFWIGIVGVFLLVGLTTWEALVAH